MNNVRLDFLLRKNKGRMLSTEYKLNFIKSGFDEADLISIGLELSDPIISNIESFFLHTEVEAETAKLNDLYMDSGLLLKRISVKLIDSDNCFIFTDYYPFCGFFMVPSKKALKLSLAVALYDMNHTCFILDEQYKFFVTINYNDKDSFEYPEIFDIQLKDRSNGADVNLPVNTH